MEKKNQVVPQGVAPGKAEGTKRRPRTVAVGKLKAERVEEPMMATKVLEKMASLSGWGLSPKGISLARNFSFAGEEDARAFSDYLVGLGIGQRVKLTVTVDGTRVGVKLEGQHGGIPSYLLDFASVLSQ